MKRLPILLIHGFNGWPQNWTGPDDRMPEFLAGLGYDPALVRVFTYGYLDDHGKPKYNNLGDLREIAHRLDLNDPHDPDAHDCSVERLARESTAAGGPDKITIIAHSSGGLIARYYLARRAPDEWGTQYRGHVGRVVFLGTPHQGVDVEDLLDPLPTNVLIYRLMVRAHFLFPPGYADKSRELRGIFHDLRQTTREAFLGETEETARETPGFKQMHPGSPFLAAINRPGAMPNEVAYHNIIGDVRAEVEWEYAHRRIGKWHKGFGDFLVSTASASTIPNARSTCDPIIEEHCLRVDLNRHLERLVRLTDEGEHPTPIHRHLRHVPGARARIKRILGT